MKRRFAQGFLLLIVGIAGSFTAAAQTETYTGTIVSYGTGRNTRTTTNTFTLNINGTTPDGEVDRLVSILQEGGQDDLLKTIRKTDLGNISIGPRLGRTLNTVRVDQIEGKKRIRAVFERWMNFNEIRGGYRSVDYPFGYIEILVDPATGKGEGTMIEAAKIRWKRDKKSNQHVVEIEDFGTFPSRLMGVTERGRK